MTLDKERFLKEETYLRENIKHKIDFVFSIPSLEKAFNETKILGGSFFERKYYSIKHCLLSLVSKNYRDAEGYKDYESWRKKGLSTFLF